MMKVDGVQNVDGLGARLKTTYYVPEGTKAPVADCCR